MMTKERAERLAILIQASGDVTMNAAFLMRHENDDSKPIKTLERSLGALQANLAVLAYYEDISADHVRAFSKEELADYNKFTHHQPPMEL